MVALIGRDEVLENMSLFQIGRKSIYLSTYSLSIKIWESDMRVITWMIRESEKWLGISYPFQANIQKGQDSF